MKEKAGFVTSKKNKCLIFLICTKSKYTNKIIVIIKKTKKAKP